MHRAKGVAAGPGCGRATIAVSHPGLTGLTSSCQERIFSCPELALRRAATSGVAGRVAAHVGASGRA